MPVLPVSRQKRPQRVSDDADNGCYGKLSACLKAGCRSNQGGVSLDIENYCTVSLFFEQAYL
ncbi:hypothetical protein FMK79_27085 [Klebsiella oxytoca]|nr:hypothetical protein [Klebsiella oxytoca]